MGLRNFGEQIVKKGKCLIIMSSINYYNSTNKPLLSISVPTYNRSYKLQKLLRFFDNENIFNGDIVYNFYDNNSTDGTKEILNDFKKIHSSYVNVIHRSSNIGGTKNIEDCYRRCEGCYSWILGDDDLVYPGTLSKIINIICNERNFSWIYLKNNHLYSDGIKYSTIINNLKYNYRNGISLFREIAYGENNPASLMFISSNIYKTDILKKAFSIYSKTKEYQHNLAVPLAMTFYVALQGRAFTTTDVCITANSVENSWKSIEYKINYRDMFACINSMCESFGSDISDFFDLDSMFPKFSEWEYLFKVGLDDNYIMDYLNKHHRMKIVLDFLGFTKLHVCNQFKKIKYNK